MMALGCRYHAGDEFGQTRAHGDDGNADDGVADS